MENQERRGGGETKEIDKEKAKELLFEITVVAQAITNTFIKELGFGDDDLNSAELALIKNPTELNKAQKCFIYANRFRIESERVYNHLDDDTYFDNKSLAEDLVKIDTEMLNLYISNDFWKIFPKRTPLATHTEEQVEELRKTLLIPEIQKKPRKHYEIKKEIKVATEGLEVKELKEKITLLGRRLHLLLVPKS